MYSTLFVRVCTVKSEPCQRVFNRAYLTFCRAKARLRRRVRVKDGTVKSEPCEHVFNTHVCVPRARVCVCVCVRACVRAWVGGRDVLESQTGRQCS
jgi:hypothetical protein